jgi:hypothetical protein
MIGGNMESLKKKIDNLHPWFDDIRRNPKISIHDVVEFNSDTWVIWSDHRGYCISHRGWSGQGTSGTYSNLPQCINYIYGILDMGGRSLDKIIAELKKE